MPTGNWKTPSRKSWILCARRAILWHHESADGRVLRHLRLRQRHAGRSSRRLPERERLGTRRRPPRDGKPAPRLYVVRHFTRRAYESDYKFGRARALVYSYPHADLGSERTLRRFAARHFGRHLPPAG